MGPGLLAEGDADVGLGEEAEVPLGADPEGPPVHPAAMTSKANPVAIRSISRRYVGDLRGRLLLGHPNVLPDLKMSLTH
jgi:hypothetical protein